MSKRIKLISTSISASAILFASNKALAVEGFVEEGGLANFVNTALNVLLGAAGFVAVIYVIMGGFNYVTSAGNPEKVATANKTIAYAIIGVVIIALAFALKSFVMSKLGITGAGEGTDFLTQ
ncbi:MAG TPA: hypothetical protein P5096_01180 [Patescibacteria group bacterium]|nr:hypothetical protein [Patescibacteria group bacterium]